MEALKNILIGTLILLFCINSDLIQGQESESATLKSDSLCFESPTLFKCNLQFPDDYKMGKPFPLVICLHGGGGSYENFKNIWKQFENPQFIMATPQAPYKWLMGDKIGYDWSAWPTGDLVFMQKALKLTSNYIENLIQSIKEKYNISGVYLLGFSQGSIITQIAGINKHDLLNGIIILSGPEINHPGKPEIVWPSEANVRSANNLRVFIAHGKSDERIDIEMANKSSEQYKKVGYDVTLFVFEGGHEINTEAMMKVEKWVKTQK